MTTFLRIDPVMLLEIGNEFKAGNGCFQHTELTLSAITLVNVELCLNAVPETRHDVDHGRCL